MCFIYLLRRLMIHLWAKHTQLFHFILSFIVARSKCRSVIPNRAPVKDPKLFFYNFLRVFFPSEVLRDVYVSLGGDKIQSWTNLGILIQRNCTIRHYLSIVLPTGLRVYYLCQYLPAIKLRFHGLSHHPEKTNSVPVLATLAQHKAMKQLR